MINASDKTEPAGSFPPFSISRPLFPRLLFSLKFGHATPEVTAASEFMSLAVAPQFTSRMYIYNETTFLREISVSTRKISFPLALCDYTFLLTCETFVSI